MEVSCSWCHQLNDPAKWRYCAVCGHQTAVPRSECNCPRCVPDVLPGGVLDYGQLDAFVDEEAEYMRDIQREIETDRLRRGDC